MDISINLNWNPIWNNNFQFRFIYSIKANYFIGLPYKECCKCSDTVGENHYNTLYELTAFLQLDGLNLLVEVIHIMPVLPQNYQMNLRMVMLLSWLGNPPFFENATYLCTKSTGNNPWTELSSATIKELFLWRRWQTFRRMTVCISG